MQDGNYEDLNFSAEEIKTLKAQKNRLALEAAYRRILGLRAQAYIKGGLAGVQGKAGVLCRTLV